jgi:FkbM family methyltransferase
MSEINRWFSVDGDRTHRLNYPLNENSIVFDLGGYQGSWTDNIWNKFKCNIYTFEPITDLAKSIESRYVNNDKVKIYSFGLSNESKKLKINLAGDASSFNTLIVNSIECEVKSINEFIEETDLTEIDLMKINIEGDEYPVLNSLISSGKIRMIKNIQVQFHRFVPNAVELRSSIQEELNKTHKQTYNYEFVWENWERL